MKTKTILIALMSLNMSFWANAENLTFKNFDKDIRLIKHENHFKNEATQQPVNVANRLIIKTLKKFNKKKLAKAHKQIQEVTELYQGTDFNYFATELKTGSDIGLVMKKLAKKRAILLVQPDILQKTVKSHEDAVHGKNPLKNPKKKTINKRQQLKSKNQIALSLSRYLKFIGADKLWEKTKGKGIKVAVIDDGFDLKHEEFKNTTLNFSYDATQQSLNSQPKNAIDVHGTKIIGVIFANHDNKGVEGIAPEAELIAIRQPDTWTSNTLLSFQIANLSKADIINCSWNSPQLMQPIAEIVNDLAKNGRNGKGTAVVFAAGNLGIEIKPNSTEASLDSAIVVAASNMLGHRALKFSNKGKSVDLLAFGLPVQTTLPNNKSGVFAKTSLSTAIVSGLSALLLSENPKLSLHDLIIKLNKILKKNKSKKQIKLSN